MSETQIKILFLAILQNFYVLTNKSVSYYFINWRLPQTDKLYGQRSISWKKYISVYWNVIKVGLSSHIVSYGAQNDLSPTCILGITFEFGLLITIRLTWNQSYKVVIEGEGGQSFTKMSA